MVRLVRENKSVRFDEYNEFLVSAYLEDGYDLIDESGKVLKRATGGREIMLNVHYNALDFIEQLKVENADLKEEMSVLENENVRLTEILKDMKTASKRGGNLDE